MVNRLEIIYRDPATLKAAQANARTHSKRQIRKIAGGIKRFGFLDIVLIDENDRIIYGHGRVAAALHLSMNEIPTVCIKGMSDAEIRAFAIAHNRLAELAGWDQNILAIEFQIIEEMEPELDLTVTGFDTAEIDLIFDEYDHANGEDEIEDQIPDVAEGSSVTRRGYIWIIGDHLVLCGDATDPNAYVVLLGGEKAALIFTDPPYNVPIAGHVSGLGRKVHAEFAMASGEMDSATFIEFLKNVLSHLAEHSHDGAIHFVCIDWRHVE